MNIIKNILNKKIEKNTVILEEYTSYIKKYITAILLGTSVSLNSYANTPQEGEKNQNLEQGIIREKVNNDFNYREPIFDEKGYLKAREDLLNPDDVEDGYNSIKELFIKLNSMIPTQVEPLIKPYYYGEVDENGEKIPTFIIIGDIHADIYNLSKEKIENLKKDFKYFLFEENEDYKPEVEVLNLLNKKFKINNFGLENEYYGEKYETNIGKEVDKLGLKSFGLENQVLREYSKLLWYKNSLIMIFFKNLGVNLDIDFSENEIHEYEEFFKNLNERNFGKTEGEIIINILKESKNLKEEDQILLYKSYRYILYKEGFMIKNNKKAQEDFIKIAKEKNTSSEKVLKLLEKVYNIDENKIIIEDRNKEGIEIALNNIEKDKIMVLVYGKKHSIDLIRQLKEKYNGKVNIYVAK